jgi:hypothetical protein
MVLSMKAFTFIVIIHLIPKPSTTSVVACFKVLVPSGELSFLVMPNKIFLRFSIENDVMSCNIFMFHFWNLKHAIVFDVYDPFTE